MKVVWLAWIRMRLWFRFMPLWLMLHAVYHPVRFWFGIAVGVAVLTGLFTLTGAPLVTG